MLCCAAWLVQQCPSPVGSAALCTAPHVSSCARPQHLWEEVQKLGVPPFFKKKKSVELSLTRKNPQLMLSGCLFPHTLRRRPQQSYRSLSPAAWSSASGSHMLLYSDARLAPFSGESRTSCVAVPPLTRFTKAGQCTGGRREFSLPF